ncbi:hypothetical protein DFH09DRAFT_1091586 [Mycena vulgaris]|nr:hypothetical protein DFH09DRAFT_1091586 [Mycena vulgaris]
MSLCDTATLAFRPADARPRSWLTIPRVGIWRERTSSRCNVHEFGDMLRELRYRIRDGTQTWEGSAHRNHGTGVGEKSERACRALNERFEGRRRAKRSRMEESLNVHVNDSKEWRVDSEVGGRDVSRAEKWSMLYDYSFWGLLPGPWVNIHGDAAKDGQGYIIETQFGDRGLPQVKGRRHKSSDTGGIKEDVQNEIAMCGGALQASRFRRLGVAIKPVYGARSRATDDRSAPAEEGLVWNAVVDWIRRAGSVRKSPL